MILHWDQELLGYHFSIVHQRNKMMTDVNTLTKGFGILFAVLYNCFYFIQYRKQRRQKSYEELVFTKEKL